ncbi:alpha/beta hydrolase [Microbacterium rhizosphaerae]|uniref:Alpha/beta hydrolase-fold protein n=1 Tax=Microbacterium rhizosphaerae TaxID=1678237 RepID=A0ABZ0SJQ9_9MICO|nr:alpha/beta hydrolase-fold protein [Microbacterium rhizosphaerae]WPR88400.1 alpha/beta hydrolase-fold protein [Microbacterium rhizosphaerae]
MNAILTAQVLDGPVPVVLYVAALALAVYLLIRRPGRGRLLASALGILAGTLVAIIVFVVSNITDAFGEQLQLEILWWAVAAFGAVGLAVANLWRSRWWRKTIAVLSIPVFIAAGAVGINAVFGLNATVADMLGISVRHPIALPKPSPTATDQPAWTPGDGSLYQAWRPPADMPHLGQQGTVTIPATVSGFHARPAGLYLPPAALVKDAPPLPLVILMMGYPGNPSPARVASVVEQYQLKHQGLAPIVLVADQIGTQGDPTCADSKMYGNAQTYITKDVVAWAAAHLHVIEDPKYWAIMGYSNGGGCAIKYGALMPQTFGTIVDISGEPYPGSVHPPLALARIFAGNVAAFEASKPINIMRKAPAGTYNGVHAVFTYGADDHKYGPDAKLVSSVARSVGMDVTLTPIPGATHIGLAFTGGVAAGLDVLYPLWGLSA